MSNLRENIINYRESNDKKILEELYLYFVPYIQNIAKRLYCEDNENELTVGFIEIIKELDIKKFSNHVIQGQIVTALMRKKIDLIRKVSRENAMKICFFEDIKIEPKEIYDDTFNIVIQDIIKALTVKEREVIKFSFIDKRKNVQIAEIMNISKQRVGEIKKNAIKKLSEIIEV